MKEAIPFDIASERIQLVDRPDGKFDKTSFTEELEKRRKALINPAPLQGKKELVPEVERGKNA